MWTVEECEKFWTARLEKALDERDEALRLADQSSLMCAEWHAKVIKLEHQLQRLLDQLKERP